MHIRFGLLTFAVLAMTAPAAFGAAEETPPSVGADTVPAKSKTEQLDTLFQTLKTAASKETAKAAEDSIWSLWLQSGSDTIDLLMNWAMKAMEALGRRMKLYHGLPVPDVD